MDPTFGEMIDTSPEARARYFALLAGLSVDQRAEKVARLGRAVRDLARADIRRTHPDAGSEVVEIELVARLYGRRVARILAPHLIDRG
ncbi:MAG: hypothetical protein R2752_20855 [Vicinamibacterales bacterium]